MRYMKWLYGSAGSVNGHNLAEDLNNVLGQGSEIKNWTVDTAVFCRALSQLSEERKLNIERV